MKSDYSLISSGQSYKLEQFGPKKLLRPSTVAFWKSEKNILDEKYDALYNPKSENWEFKTQKFTEWQIQLDQIKLLLKPQANGQIGFFPDHYGYMPKLTSAIKEYKEPQVLNLFAYTGMASMYALKAGANVTHVDVSKKFLDWTNENLKINNLSSKNIRLIPEDALVYLEREAKRNKTYQIIIADPPSFYRTGKNKIWQLEENFHKLLDLILKVLDPKSGQLFFTCHSFSIIILKNLLSDFKHKGLTISHCEDLLLTETTRNYHLPAGVFALCRLTAR
jgi:23S rRNA (cytosine1962-C5)-methyltransferase